MACGHLFIALILCLAPSILQAATHTIRAGQALFDGGKANVKPGDMIFIQAGDYKTLRIVNVRGTAEKPVQIRNSGGIVTVSNTDRGYAIAIQGSQHVRFSGSGTKSTVYGFRCATKKKGMMAFHINDRSSDIEVDRVEVFGAGFAGFNVKDEPKEDGSTNRGAFVMYNISLHHNYVHDVSGEGFYIGHTFYNGWKHPKSGKVLYPHVIKGLRVYANVIHNSGCEGIQIGSAVEDVDVFGNVIVKTGVSPFAKWQNNGIQIGVPTAGRVYCNILLDVPATGIALWGNGTNAIYNNVIARCGGHGIYVHKVKGSGYTFAHNTFVDTASACIRVGNPEADVYRVYNNLFVTAGAPLQIHKGKLQQAGNLTVKSVKMLDFLDVAKSDFRLGRNSRARGKSVRMKDFVLDHDLLGRKRPGMQADLGAFQFAEKDRSANLDLNQPIQGLPVPPFTPKKR